ncbi:hypothetical protein FRC16_010566 [Serendipita sp. 398]|nr:hypothetical protein FRC16_010566 [Serendipita sp. 398]
MELLQKYVKHLKEKEGSDVVVIGGYLIYEQDGYIWIPVDDVITKCAEIAGMEPKDESHMQKKCRPSRPLNRRLTKYFLGEENKLRTEAHTDHEEGHPAHSIAKATENKGFIPPLRCFLEEMRSQAMRG